PGLVPPLAAARAAPVAARILELCSRFVVLGRDGARLLRSPDRRRGPAARPAAATDHLAYLYRTDCRDLLAGWRLRPERRDGQRRACLADDRPGGRGSCPPWKQGRGSADRLDTCTVALAPALVNSTTEGLRGRLSRCAFALP